MATLGYFFGILVVRTAVQGDAVVEKLHVAFLEVHIQIELFRFGKSLQLVERLAFGRRQPHAAVIGRVSNMAGLLDTAYADVGAREDRDAMIGLYGAGMSLASHSPYR